MVWTFAPFGSRSLIGLFLGVPAAAAVYFPTLLVVSWFTTGTALLVVPLVAAGLVVARVVCVRAWFHDEMLEVRNAFATHIVPITQIEAIDQVALPWGMNLPQVAALRLGGEPGRRILKVHATASLESDELIEQFTARVSASSSAPSDLGEP